MDILLFGGIVTIGSRILSSRKNKLGITRKELSEKIGISITTIQDWENEKIIPKAGIVTGKQIGRAHV